MKDLTIALENRPGALAEMGEALGRAGVSIEGGGAWVVGGKGVAHFLFADGTAARRALEAAGIQVLAERQVLVQRLRQDVPGQLGSRKFVGVFATFAIHEPFVYVEPRTWTISGESCTHGNKRILEDRSKDLVRLWRARDGAPIN